MLERRQVGFGGVFVTSTSVKSSQVTQRWDGEELWRRSAQGGASLGGGSREDPLGGNLLQMRDEMR